ncbi:MAG: hypothetical protein GY720_06530, partial [bacterium]|nr:hypothetical protein [bacterium]
VRVNVADAAGEPVAGAEMAVVVVDEAVLALSGYELPDPLDIFYRPISSHVWSRYLRDSIELTDPALLDDKLSATTESPAETTAAASDVFEEVSANLSGGDMADEARAGSYSADDGEGTGGDAIDVRNVFSALAVFQPEVMTDADGNATIDVPLPDSLTRYRVMVVAVAGTDEFGSTESNITARLPLMVRPSAPRFLNFGDQFELPVVIQN